jgi:CBS domain containing-hemolysin-like protein
MQELIITILAVIIISAICSGTEAALLSVSILKIKQLATGTSKSSATALLKIKEKINRPLTTIVILNNVANIGGSMMVGEKAISIFGSKWVGLFSALLTFLIIIFGEIIPKTTGENYSLKVSLFCAKPILLLTKLFMPLVWIIEIITLKIINSQIKFTTNENEIKAMAHIGHEEGVIEKKESEMIHRIFELNDVTAEKIMTPRVAITYIQIDKNLEDIKDFIMKSQHSRIIVIKADKDEVEGIVFKDELLTAIIKGEGNKPVSNFIHEANFVIEAMKVNQLLAHFRETRQHIAIVVDEYGGISGVVTLEDVVEELTGEIVDETDTVIDMQDFAKRQKKTLPKYRQSE